jgi:hypothetical protein
VQQSFSDLNATVAEPGATESYTKLWQSMSGESLGASPLGNFEVFQRAYNAIDASGMYDAAGGMQMIDDHLDKTGQSYEGFAGSLSGKNQQLLHEMSMDWSQVGMTMDGTGETFQKAGEKAQAGFSTMTSSAGDADQAVGEFLGKTNKAMGSAGESTGQWVKAANGFMVQMGDVMEGPAYSKPVKMGDAFGEMMGGIGNALNEVAMPLMAAQMIGQTVQQVGQAMYDSAAIAEGPAAHSFGTFTGTVDALGQSLQRAGGHFSEGFGQALLPTLNALNSQAGGLDLGGLGQFVGGVASTLTNLSLITTGVDPLGGVQGLINQGASMLGLQQPFQGPAPVTQYQQYMAKMPQTIQDATTQTQEQANLTMEEAVSPAFLASQQQAQAAQTIYQRAQQSYNISHPVNLAKMADNAQYNLYAQQQEQNYQYQMNNQPSWAQDIGDYWGGFFATANTPPRPLSSPNAQGAANNYGSQYYGQTGSGGPYGGGGGGGGGGGFDIGGFFGGIGKSISDAWNAPNGGADTLGMLFSPKAWGFGGDTTPIDGPTPISAGGCFVAGTPVLMSDGTSKSIEALRVDERVLAHDGKQQIHATVIACISFPSKQTYKLTFSDGNVLTTTDSHPIATSQGWKSISPASTANENPGLPVTTLTVGDNIYTADGTLCRLISILKREITTVYNITVDGSHTYYASNVLVHNAKQSSVGSMTNEGVGSEQVQVSHTFTAQVQWEANNLSKQFTGVAQWAGQGLAKTFNGIASWVGSGLANTFNGIASWIGSGLANTFNGVASWIGSGLANTFNGVANWVGQGLSNTFNGVASWVGQGLANTFKGIASWAGQGLEHTFNAVASWTAQNLTPNFTVNPSFSMLAEGTSNWGGGPAIVGEGGAPEVVEHNGQYSLIDRATLLDLPSGANVYPMKNLQSSGVTQFADGTGGNIIPLNIGLKGGNNNAPESVNIYLQVDGQTFWSATGVSLAQSAYVASGNRSY